MVAAYDARAHDRRCVALAMTADRVRLVLHDIAGAGGRVEADALLEGTDCRLPARVSVLTGAAPAGAIVLAEGRISVVRRWGRLSLRIEGTTLGAEEGRALLPRFRAAAQDAIRRRFGADAPLVLALVAAEGSAVDRAVRDRFADAGLVHALSVSGLHVAIIAVAIELLGSVAGLRPRPALATGALGALVYVVMIGIQPAALRAVVMLGMTVGGRLLQRPTTPWAGLAVGGSVPLLVDPRMIAHPGWQLSVAGMVGLVLAGTVRRRWLSGRLRGVPMTVAESILASTAATLTTAPLVAWHFGRLSLVGPVSNLVAAPVIGLLQPTLFLALLLEPVPPLAAFVADAARPLLHAFDAIARVAAAVPGAALDYYPTLGSALLGAVLVGALVVASEARHAGGALLIAATAAALLAWLPRLPTIGPRVAELHVLDVGQGDALAVRTPRGRWLLVDAGASWPGGDEGRRTVVPYLSRRGGEVVAFVLSHPDADHVGGAEAVIERLGPRAFWDGAYVSPSAPYRAALRAAQVRGVPWRRVLAGDSLVVDGVTVTVLSPDPHWLSTRPSANDASVVLRVRFGAVRFLLVGDAESAQEEWLLARDALALRADVLKLGHHGSRTSTAPRFLDAVAPRVAVVSVGAGNRFGHPAPEVLRRLAERGIPLWRTDRLGPIVVRTDGRRLTLLADDERWDFGPD